VVQNIVNLLVVVLQRGIIVDETRGHFGSSEEEECLPLETVTRKMVKTQLTQKTKCYSELQSMCEIAIAHWPWCSFMTNRRVNNSGKYVYNKPSWRFGSYVGTHRNNYFLLQIQCYIDTNVTGIQCRHVNVR
jgi:hypothetical protein